jgi:hypothetical protein
MVQRQPEQERYDCETNTTARSRGDQRDPQTIPPIGYDEAIAGRELDGGESLLSGAPREGEAEFVHRASQTTPFPQAPEPAVSDDSSQHSDAQGCDTQDGDAPPQSRAEQQLRQTQQ